MKRTTATGITAETKNNHQYLCAFSLKILLKTLKLIPIISVEAVKNPPKATARRVS